MYGGSGMTACSLPAHLQAAVRYLRDTGGWASGFRSRQGFVPGQARAAAHHQRQIVQLAPCLTGRGLLPEKVCTLPQCTYIGHQRQYQAVCTVYMRGCIPAALSWHWAEMAASMTPLPSSPLVFSTASSVREKQRTSSCTAQKLLSCRAGIC